MNVTMGVGLVNKVIPTPVPTVLQRIREAIDKDAVEALDFIKLALQHHTKYEQSPGWWDADLRAPVTSGSQSPALHRTRGLREQAQRSRSSGWRGSSSIAAETPGTPKVSPSHQTVSTFPT
ncbi:hypothetical protein FIBSPDRAFT_892469 [Athelia psychrophila]|uniref:Uncharacterized protein n=1 Tax=Athelia psychrophila TaxID=1759441 RepID=A0A166IDA8_9AGAM|nr:hypothetical protein FIBSPDRAFT_892469 [Fibularhizoctonia sp. CBS 109695]